MMSLLWLFLSVLVQFVSASIEVISPHPGAVVHAGEAIDIKWTYTGNSTFQTPSSVGYAVFLCAGGNDEGSYERLAHLAEDAISPNHVSFSAQIEPNIGGMHTNAYFLEIAIDTSSAVTSFFSSRFSLEDMTGDFSEKVKGGLDSISGTDGPATKEGVPVERRAGDAAQHTVPYQDQTGTIRYAPMPKAPPTKITKNKATPQYPTSSFDIATAYLPTPTIQTTVSVVPASSVEQIENTAAPAAEDEDMRRFLNRWRD